MIVCNWLCEWNCNLNCTYCSTYNDNPHYKNYKFKKNNVEKSKKEIISLQPDIIRISGGEPALMKNFAENIKEIKQKTNAKIYLNTNGMFVNKLKKVLLYIDNLQISYDGNNEINKLTRGVNGEEILKSIKELYPLFKEKEFVVSTVLTTHNKEHLEEIGNTLKKISPKIYWVIIPVEPLSSPISTIKNKEDLEAYNLEIQKLSKKFLIYDIKADNYLLQTTTRCKRGLSTYNIYPDGKVRRCWENNRIDFAFKALKKSIINKETKKFLSNNKDIVKQLVKPDCAICPTPCNCNINIENEISDTKLPIISH